MTHSAEASTTLQAEESILDTWEKAEASFSPTPIAKLIHTQISLERKWEIKRTNVKMVLKNNVDFELFFQDSQGTKIIKGFLKSY